MSQITRNPDLSQITDPDPFRYGWKEEYVEQPDGRLELVNIPLTLEDLLHPEENYKIMNGSRHDDECDYLKHAIRNWLAADKHTLVLSDTGVYWDEPALKHHSPDVSVIFGIREPREQWPSFHVAEEGVRPTLLIEVVSPLHRHNDVVTKVKQYHAARVPWYVIVDRIQYEGPPTFIGYRYTPEGYVEFPPDEQGRLFLERVNLLLGVHNDRVALFDPQTGEELGDFEASVAALRAERLARQEAEKKAHDEAEKAKAEVDLRQIAEQKAHDEAQARAMAEKKAHEEAQARATAEKKAHEEAQARATAEKKAHDEIALRQRVENEKEQAEQRAQEAQRQLVALLQRLRDAGLEPPA